MHLICVLVNIITLCYTVRVVSYSLLPLPAARPLLLKQTRLAQLNADSTVQLKQDVPAGKYDTTYCICGNCKTAFRIDEFSIDDGLKVKCGVCRREWFQTKDNVLKTDDLHQLLPVKEVSVDEAGPVVAGDLGAPTAFAERIGIFVGNLPRSFTEQQIGELFAEYGVTNVVLVKDEQQLSKGFAFVDVSARSTQWRCFAGSHLSIMFAGSMSC
jgi:predicted Zn finger-like uncharacterized protein